jgi:hypothetical protein
MDVQLTLINRSGNSNVSQIVIFQKNVAPGWEDFPIAWRVIENLGLGDRHPFVYPLDFFVDVADSYGNRTPQVPVREGQCLAVTSVSSGTTLARSGESVDRKWVQVRNDLRNDAVSVDLYRDRYRLATKSSIAPQQSAVFQFKPVIWIGVVSEVQEGAAMNSAIVSQMNSEISLLGIRKADIVMTGGGTGSGAKPVSFALQNVELVQDKA